MSPWRRHRRCGRGGLPEYPLCLSADDDGSRRLCLRRNPGIGVGILPRLEEEDNQPVIWHHVGYRKPLRAANTTNIGAILEFLWAGWRISPADWAGVGVARDLR